MAFMGRGDFPSMEDNSTDTMQNQEYWDAGYGYYRRYYYYVPLDNTYIVMQMIVTFVILVVGFITFLTTYQSTIVDPIESTKKLLIHTYLIIIGVLLTVTFIINFFSKSEIIIQKRLGIILIISIGIMILFFGIKLNLDANYTKDKFEQFYEEQNVNPLPNSSVKSKVDIGITGMSLKTEKEYYTDECLKLYSIFSTKAYGTMGLHLLLNILMIYQMIKLTKMQGKKQKLEKDDLILFDEEQNIKI